MYSISRTIHFSYGHRLLNYQGKCAHLHGHNGRVEIQVSASKLDDLGMVMDFFEIKKKLGEWIDKNLDHRMIHSEKDPYAALLQRAGEPVVLTPQNPTAEFLAEWIFKEARKMKLPVSKVTLWETESCCAEYYE